METTTTDIAQRAYSLLKDAATEACERLPTELVIRQSCGCPGP